MTTLQEQLAAKAAADANKDQVQDQQPQVQEVVVVAPEIETSPYKVISRRTGYQSATRIMRPNALGYYIPQDEDEVAILESLAEQGFIIKE